MAGNGREISRKQERFLQGLLLGQAIVDAARAADVSERTAHRWIAEDLLFQAERTRREGELKQAEQELIERIMTTGYAAVHERVKSLNAIAHEAEKPYTDTDTGKVRQLWNSPDHLREWRGLLDDLARETGGRVKKQEIEHSGLKDLLDSEHAALLAELAALPDDATQDKNTDSGTGADSA